MGERDTWERRGRKKHRGETWEKETQGRDVGERDTGKRRGRKRHRGEMWEKETQGRDVGERDTGERRGIETGIKHERLYLPCLALSVPHLYTAYTPISQYRYSVYYSCITGISI